MRLSQYSQVIAGCSFALLLVLGLGACDGCGEAPRAEVFDAIGIDTGSDNLCAGAICGAGELCRRDRCTVPCEEDDACIFGERCTSGGYCYPQIPEGESTACEDDSECLSRDCHDGYCIVPRLCVNGVDCFDDEICTVDGACAGACEDASDCPAEQACISGGCTTNSECSETEPCASGLCEGGECLGDCDPSSEAEQCGQDSVCSAEGQCLPRCNFDAECLDGACVHGSCVPDGVDTSVDPLEDDPDEEPGDDSPDACETLFDCDGENERCENGLCIGIDICADDAECNEGTYCSRGQCRPFCDSDDECRGEQLCEEGRCVAEPEDVACRSSEQCEPCESCIYGVCTVSEFFCRQDDDCGIDKLCRNGFCTFECEAQEDCPHGQSCIDMVCLDDPPLSAECVFNEECDTGVVCINGRCHTDCETHSECGERQMCDHGICQPDRRPGQECTRNTHCEEGECVDGHCALACWEDRDCATHTCDTGFCTR